ncbi:putative pentatricopeptide repeat-containing protein At5g09950 [Chenopodium quinoa]|uniref:DYW domain-containing protein n=1 Tax=Chenopodium quinoa TaxID=63459 RepID=A0A803MGK1_CHEQI|nr:putative pentatricopeptide repeat-containing protein At5g09950 [Chenopodium quinoa]
MSLRVLQRSFITWCSFRFSTLAATTSSHPRSRCAAIVDHHDTFLPFSSSYPPLQHTCSSEIRDFFVYRYQHSCSSIEANQLHLGIYKHGFEADLFLVNTLINVYVRFGDLVSARKVFDEMPERNLVSWACLISGYGQNGMLVAACATFRDMVSAGYSPNSYAFGSVLRACQDLGPDYLKFGLQIHGMISKMSYAHDVLVGNVLISMYGSCFLGSGDNARRVFDEIDGKIAVSWNSIISVYSKRGDAIGAFKMFARMQHECSGFNFKPNAYTLSSLIAVASSSSLFGSSLLQQIASRVQKSGFLDDLYVGSALVSGLAKFGLIDDSWKIFECMSTRNAVTMNGLMVGLVNQKRGEQAVDVFKRMKHLVEVNPDSYVVLLSAFAEFDELEEGRRKGKELHAYAIRSGLRDAKVAVANALINMYARCGAIDSSRAVFEQMGERDLISWNSLIAGLDQNELFEDAVTTFCRMRRSGIRPTNFALISCLSSCASLGWLRQGAQVHTEALRLGLDSDVSVSNALLSMYADTRSFKECQKLFTLMPEHDQVSWNSIIGALANSETYALESVKYILEMMRSGCRLNGVTLVNILSAISSDSLSLSKLGPQVHALAFNYGFANNITIENALISCYGRCGRMEDCESIFSRMAQKDEVSWNTMISGCVHNEYLSKAVDLVWLMMQSGQKLDHFTFATVLSACASVATLERGMEVHACQIRAHLESDVVVGSAIVDMYAKCGRIAYAARFFDLMPVKNIFTWNTMISGYARHGFANKALEIFEQMKEEGQPPNHVTFVGVLSACSHGGLVEKGFKYFESMSSDYGLEPQMEHFSCMVDLLGRSGKLDKVEDFINRMPMKPNNLIWRTVLGSCSRTSGRNSELGKRAAEMLLQLEPENGANYVLLGNMYAAGSNWENLAITRSAMSLAAAKKQAGCSWVTMRDGVHVFVAGDISHPEKDAIYEKLGELLRKMREAGYVPQTSFALYDLESESKEELLSYHSEKLAIAFVLTRTSNSTIRIMKNLRVCGDCHSAFRYISKIVGRQIVLRDSNRFHHFTDGECSCGDYW